MTEFFLEVRCEGRAEPFSGWWRVEGRRLLSMVSSPSPAAPERLVTPASEVARSPRARSA